MKLHEILDTPYDAGEQSEFQDAESEGQKADQYRGKYLDSIESKHSAGSNMSKARRIAAGARVAAKGNNPGEPREPSGWTADPHQGGHGNNFLNRGSHG